MDVLKVTILSFSSVVILFILTKSMGNKHISQLNMFDYVISITIGSVAAEMATKLEAPLHDIVAMVVYAFMSIFISFITSKSRGVRKVIIGRPILLMDNNVIYRSNLIKAKMDCSDFLIMCRAQGYFNLNQIQTAILEATGTLSILPKSGQRPLTPQDMNIAPQQEYIITNVIMDGEILKRNIQLLDMDTKWIEKQMKKQGFTGPKEIFLATCDMEKNVTFYPMVKSKLAMDRFE